MGRELNAEELKEFDLADTDSSGGIDFYEFVQLLVDIGFDPVPPPIPVGMKPRP